MADERSPYSLAADGEYLSAACVALDLDNVVFASTCALIHIAETLESFRSSESGFLQVETYSD